MQINANIQIEWSAKMNDLLPPNDPIDAVGEAYELLLEKSLQNAHKSGAFVHHMIEKSRDEIVALNKFREDEIVKLADFLKRDLIDAAHYLNNTEKELKYWLGFDVALLKRELWEQFSRAAGQTTEVLNQLNPNAVNSKYYSGEITGLGTLECDQCGEKVHFQKPSKVPICANCKCTVFHRQKF